MTKIISIRLTPGCLLLEVFRGHLGVVHEAGVVANLDVDSIVGCGCKDYNSKLQVILDNGEWTYGLTGRTDRWMESVKLFNLRLFLESD